MVTKIAVSKYCEECLAFRQNRCKGKEASQKIILYFGGRRTGQRFRHGLNFCKQYEFDERLYKFADGSGQVGTIHTVRKRQAKRDEKISNQEIVDDFDLGQSLSSADFADILI